jgi:ABC-type sugar transport system substrate-binding protein
MKAKLTGFLIGVILLSLVVEKAQAGGGQAKDASSRPAASQAAPTSGLPVKGAKSSHKNSGTAPINIAFVLYSWTDDQGQYIQQYGAYLTENFNIKIEYVTAENSAEATIDTVESLCSKGVDGIVLANEKGFQSWAAICEENKVYYSIMLGQLNDEDDRAFAAKCKYFQGSLGNYDYTFLGEIYAKHAIEKGFKNVLVSGAAPGMQLQTDQMIAGFTASLDKAGVKYKTVRAAFIQLFTAVAGALASDVYDIVFCPIGMMNFAVSNIYANKLVGKTKAMGHNTSEDLQSAMEAGVVEMFTDNMTSDVGVNVAFIINAVEGNAYPDWPANECVYIKAPSFVIENGEDFAVYSKNVRNYESNPFLCSAEMVKSMILSYNKDASFNSIRNYIETMSLDKLKGQK